MCVRACACVRACVCVCVQHTRETEPPGVDYNGRRVHKPQSQQDDEKKTQCVLRWIGWVGRVRVGVDRGGEEWGKEEGSNSGDTRNTTV